MKILVCPFTFTFSAFGGCSYPERLREVFHTGKHYPTISKENNSLSINLSIYLCSIFG